jgi:hypothetical protein
VEFPWGNFDMPLPIPFSIIWKGNLVIPRDGTYTFYTESDDGSWLRIDGKEIIKNDGIHAPLLKEGKMELKRGNHRLVLKYNNVTGGGSIKLFWSPPGKNMEIIPEQNLKAR